MVYTRSAFNQEQENRLQNLRNLRLNYFINTCRSRRMDPITPYSERIDLRTEHGRKIYEGMHESGSGGF
jgi:predicted HicB family RNase H-like nuclease